MSTICVSVFFVKTKPTKLGAKFSHIEGQDDLTLWNNSRYLCFQTIGSDSFGRVLGCTRLVQIGSDGLERF